MSDEIYACTWLDAHGSKGMIAEHEIEHKPYVFTIVGFLIRTDEAGVSIAAEKGEDGLYRDHTFIPRAIVREEWSLGKLKKPRKRKPKETSPETPSPA